MDDNNIDNEENHPVQESEQERIAASNDRASATTAEIIKQGLQRAPEDVLKGRKIYKINRTAFQSKTPAADSVTGTSVAATTNGTTATSSATTDKKNEVLLVHTRTRVETWVPTVSRKVLSDASIAVLVASVVVFGIFALGFFTSAYSKFYRLQL